MNTLYVVGNVMSQCVTVQIGVMDVIYGHANIRYILMILHLIDFNYILLRIPIVLCNAFWDCLQHSKKQACFTNVVTFSCLRTQ